MCGAACGRKGGNRGPYALLKLYSYCYQFGTGRRTQKALRSVCLPNLIGITLNTEI